MKWKHKPNNYLLDSNTICITADHGTNLFNSPSSNRREHNFPYWYENYTGDFIIKCKVSPDFFAKYDQGDIVIWETKDKWIKLAYKKSDNGYPSIVSVVTNGTSDDCTGPQISGPVWLLICRKENSFALHYSTDGLSWNLTRIFNLKMKVSVQIGISAQCPSGEKCTVIFEHLTIGNNPYSDIRNLKID